MAKSRGPGKPFQPGNQFGRGRPSGSRNKSKLRLSALLENDGEAIVRTVIDLAKTGDPTALKLCMERLISPCRERSIELKLPADVTTPAGLLGALGAVLAALAGGEITPSETLATARVLDGCRQAIETQELDRRLTALERSTAEEAPTGRTGSLGDVQPRDSTALAHIPNQAVIGGYRHKELGNE
jgi:hypothetical protein